MKSYSSRSLRKHMSEHISPHKRLWPDDQNRRDTEEIRQDGIRSKWIEDFTEMAINFSQYYR